MRPLTAPLVRDFPYSGLADPGVLKRGRDYYRDQRVVDLELISDSVASCLVEGDSDDYEVEIKSTSGKYGLSFSCNCPYADDGSFCKHMYAAALELSALLEDGADKIQFNPRIPAMPDRTRGKAASGPAQAAALPGKALAPSGKAATRKWQEKLGVALAAGAQRFHPHKHATYVGVVVLERDTFLGYQYRYSSQPADYSTFALKPFAIQAPAWAEFTRQADVSAADIDAQLGSRRNWIRIGQVLSQSLDPAACLNADAHSASFLNVLAERQRFYYGSAGASLGMLLSLLSRLSLPLFLGSTRYLKIDGRLRLLPEPVDISLDLQNSANTLRIVPGYELNGQFVPLAKPPVTLSSQPVWALLDDAVAQPRHPRALDLANAFPVDVPAADVEAFRERYLAPMAQTLPLRGGVVQWRDVQAEPVPRLYLRDDKDSGLCAEVRFGYDVHEVAAAKSPESVSVISVPHTWELIRLHRQVELEAARLESLSGPTYGLKRGGSLQPFGTLALRSRVHPYDFLLHSVPQLAQAGFEIYGADSLKIGKVNRNQPMLRVGITSGIDWFDLQMMVEFGDQQISLQAVRKALQRGERYIKLADGSAGQIPAEWLAKYRYLWKLATETDAGLRVSDVHLALIDRLLEDDPAIALPPDLAERRERLRSFERIAPRPLAQNFRGELRPYQQHGVDWLHFLHEFQFGGVLADDMGLGKTIQVLAFLQALKEQRAGARGAASLLVVPKSLIDNWQRESARFTPDLGLLLYFGNFRSKDTKRFEGYDLVLTTYGTMLRDIANLRDYRFNYAILDESQAIKNPLAKSGKAARLIQAKHRLVLTGTPVENNTLELWSQFAFVNPGLLGGMDFFRTEFAAPIESHGDETAAAMLRKLVYPFILRRTKAQVAPELPPRTERIIYADMDSAQKKLYAQTRDRYRAELLGLIESQGINDARFKILEGLLRLRQIAIHPALVSGEYRGLAPKLEILLETLETLQAENHKALIFSQFVGVLKLVKRELDARGLRYMYLDGSVSDRQARVDKFQNDPAYPFFLISLKAGGVGLNLTAADYVIHLDPWWNPAVEMQASDRAHRIGQDKPVFVYKLIARDTVEEKILKLQEKKRALVNSLVTTEGAFFKALTPDDVKVLFG